MSEYEALTIDDFWIEMAHDPGMQGLRQFANGSMAFTDEEFIELLKVTFPAFASIEDEEECRKGLNRAFAIWKLYRLHESMLLTAINGRLVVTGIDDTQPNALNFEMVDE